MRVLPRGLRARSAAGFAVLALVLSLVLSLSTYQLARWYLLDQRQSLAVKQAVLHAQVLGGELSGLADGTEKEVLAALEQTRGRAVLQVHDTWYSAVVDLDQSRVPPALVDSTRAGTAQSQRIVVNQVPYIVIGIPVPEADAVYFEFVTATEYERTLRTLAYVLMAVASITTALGALSGWVLSRRVLRPLDTVAVSARAMSEGDLQQRLEVGDDPDLRPVAESFNSMAQSLEQRIAREQRFTADVSHELRTPLTAMSSAVALAQRSGNGERTAFAIDVIAGQVDHLRQLTLELLELARIDAGREDVRHELVDVSAIVERQAALHEVSPALVGPVAIPVVHEVNPLRFERVVANLLENAARYGGGATLIECRRAGSTLRLVVQDAGPGIPAHERQSVFGRFHRGTSTAGADHPKGTGLGLSLVEEYVRLDGGAVWIEDSASGGARFVVEIPGRS
ncbi:MAG: HAMP domain-containing sensor histidine kinase [Actinomycetota bacterium]|nr:HAMP domain-containing sensor histidine kinase [Actinomycetota bacterium]